MTISEEIDRVTFWLARAEEECFKRGVGGKHAEWALGVWNEQAQALVVLDE